ncbi:MAG: hypothetical protein RL385_33 [Pseudomonadota bacterium]|jgi:hypothetical protein
MDERLTYDLGTSKEMSRDEPRAAPEGSELARRNALFPAFVWLGSELAHVPEAKLLAARSLVELWGEDPRGEAVAKALGSDVVSVRGRARSVDVERRLRRRSGEAPAGKPLEERRRYVAVKILVRWLVRLMARRPRLPDGSVLDVRSSGILALVPGAQGGVEATQGVEAHPRASIRRVRAFDETQQKRVVAALDAMERGELGPSASTKPLPARVCAATRRNLRRASDARALYDEERFLLRAQKLERQSVGGRLYNPGSVRKRLPLAEGRKAREIYTQRTKALAFLRGLPLVIRARLLDAATKGGVRGRFGEEALRLYAFYAYLLFQAETPRPVIRRDGYDRAVEGLSREALAVAFVWNPRTEQSFHANTLSAMAAQLEEAGLLVREAPNRQRDVYRGVTGWALYIYRLRNAEQLCALLAALGEAWMPKGASAQVAIAGDAAS